MTSKRARETNFSFRRIVLLCEKNKKEIFSPRESSVSKPSEHQKRPIKGFGAKIASLYTARICRFGSPRRCYSIQQSVYRDYLSRGFRSVEYHAHLTLCAPNQPSRN